MINWSLSNVGEPMQLYLATSINELNEKATVPTPPNHKVEMTLNELEKRANMARLEGNHELCYVYILRFLSIATEVRKRKQPVNVDVANLVKMMAFAEDLSTALRLRYAELNGTKTTAENDETKADQQLPNEVKDKPNANGNSNKNQSTKKLPESGNKKPSEDKKKVVDQQVDWIEATQLYQLMKTGRNADNVLVLDARCREDFDASHIDFSGVVSVPSELLSPGKACSGLAREIAVSGSHNSALFERRQQAKHVVLVDWEGKESKQAEEPIWVLHEALTRWNEVQLTGELKLLRGGLNDFVLRYPHVTTASAQLRERNEKKLKQTAEDEFAKPLKLTADYPDFYELFGKKPAAQVAQTLPLPAGPKPVPDRSSKPPPVFRSAKPSLRVTSPLVVADSAPSPLAATVKVPESGMPTVDRSKKPQSVPKPSSKPQQPQQVVEESREDATKRFEESFTPDQVAALRKELVELTKRKEQQLKEMASIMRERRKLDREPAKPVEPVEKSIPVEEEKIVKPIVVPSEDNKENAAATVRPRARSMSPKKAPDIDRALKPAVAAKPLTHHVPRKAVGDSNNNSSRKMVSVMADNSADFSALQAVHGPTTSGVAGLRNLGNTCFMAAVLQCLAAAPAFSDLYTQSKYQLLVASSRNSRPPNVTIEMARLLKAMLGGDLKSVAPAPLKTAMGSRHSAFRTRDQQDAQEFLAALLDELHEELNSGEKKKVNNDDDEDAPKNVQAAWTDYVNANCSPVVRLFHGMLRSTVVCSGCRSSLPKYDAFAYLTLPVPQSRQAVTLHDCVGAYVYPELIDGWRCSTCKQVRQVTRRLEVVQPPHLLVIHLNRFAWSGEWRAKVTTPVHFELDNFRLASRSYSLFGIANHFGTLEAGHYTATTRLGARRNLSWFRYDDAEVAAVSSHSLVTDARHASSAYLLFYAADDVDWPALSRHQWTTSQSSNQIKSR